jgi:cellulose synthase/poly-beta-1,6-N-acetylglucosamine synthase-like glycosyltransferase
MAKALIELATLVLLIAWVGYPCAMYAVARLRHRGTGVAAPGDLKASIVIATRDEVGLVSKRVANIESHREELQSLEIIVAVDHSGRIGAERYREALGEKAIVIEGDSPGGKAATLNAGVRAATNDIVIFADTAQVFLPGAMRSLVEMVRRPAIGAATGHLRSENNRRNVILGVFWAYELWLRKMESSVDSLVGVTGAIYAVRRNLWEPLPAGLINDDVYVPLWVVHKGSRAVTCETAFAVDTRVLTPQEEFRRKVRTQTGILQLCALCPSILNPLRNRIWVQFVCHKLLRIVTPYAVLLGALGVTLASPVQVVVLSMAVGAAVVVIARAAAPRESLVARVLQQAGWTALILSAPLVATVYAIKGNWNVWGASRSSTE